MTGVVPSQLVMGTVRAEPAVWERYVAAGGSAFDTARHYGDESEGTLGAFLERHGLRDRVTLIGKGAHTPTCAPEHVGPQLERSLDLLRTDRVDLYLLHRDDPAIPVEEWADALQRAVEAGRVRAIGASNWSVERFETFNEYARGAGLTPFSVLSNQLSLAEMHEPVWAGCVSAFDRATRGWLERTQTPLLAWSAQARGFFSGRPADDEMRRSWISPTNAERLERAEVLGAELGVPPVAVALAWVLAQPFPASAVVGPRDTGELNDCLAALGITLSAEARIRLAA